MLDGRNVFVRVCEREVDCELSWRRRVSLRRGQGNHSHIPTILFLLLCFLSSAEEEHKNSISISDGGAICECLESNMKYPSSMKVERQIRYERQISDHPCFRESSERFTDCQFFASISKYL
jgi:hypothetical protein